MPPPTDILTTGQVAKICSVAPRTVSKWFDTGQLRGYRIPGSKDRRIPLDQLIRFMKAHGIPLTGLEGYRPRVLIVDPDAAFARALVATLSGRGLEARAADGVLQAGLLVERLKPQVVVLDVGVAGLDPAEFCRVLRGHEDLDGTRVLAIGHGLDEAAARVLEQQGFEATLAKPFDAAALIQRIEQALAVAV